MVSSSGHRPPVTEDVAEAMIKDIKSSEGKMPTSEVPLAFQAGSGPPINAAAISNTRKQMTLFGAFAVAVLLVLIVVWWAA
ncbi:MAG TPA: hypothetical protein VL202_00585 [Pararhizobium sp.]|uniref:hypothetical protein n=1 Tax=Pararhizobium sp. TaxID=1977563 RepID=UPI002CC30559|nr:hypothetical protein [Pararhizobium sp.]HTO29667.1 hypothetical protein [Pararhizobium sp.]